MSAAWVHQIRLAFVRSSRPQGGFTPHLALEDRTLCGRQVALAPDRSFRSSPRLGLEVALGLAAVGDGACRRCRSAALLRLEGRGAAA